MKTTAGLKLLIVMNDYGSKTNGMAISTQRFVKELRSMGVTVRIMAAGSDAADNRVDYPLPTWKIPVLDGIIRREGFTFAKTDRKRIEAAVEWSDIVHVEDPFPLCSAAVHIAGGMGKPVVGTWHLYPENMTMSAHLDRIKPLNTFFFYQFRSAVYDHCDRIVCPSKKVKSRLEKSGCTVPMRVISNGIDPSFIGRPENRSDSNPFAVVTIGRLSPEKDQMTLIRALGKSGHEKDMQLIIAGKGPLEKKLKKEASALSMVRKPIIRYFSQKQLRALLTQADLYVHCAAVEVEGMSAMEAFASGAVPVIARAPLSATDEYAIQKEMIFPCGNSDVLAARIDYWFEHPQERKSASKKMQKKAESLTVKKSAEKLLKLYDEVR